MNKKKKQAKLRSIGFNGICNRCGSNKNMTLHHIFPKRRGHQRLQTNLPRNQRYEALCKRCHNKENKTAPEIIQKEHQSQQDISKLTLSKNSSGLVSQPADKIKIELLEETIRDLQPIVKHKFNDFKRGLKIGKAQAISEFKEKLKEKLREDGLCNEYNCVKHTIEIIDKTAQEML
jgi:hypothetical protein